MREFSANVADSDLVRVTGYMIRKRDLARFATEGSRLQTTCLGPRRGELTGIRQRAPQGGGYRGASWMTMACDEGGRKGTVSRWLPFSCVDGPGNRLVLFLQGCNFRCPGCHNPHTMGGAITAVTVCPVCPGGP